MGMVLNAGPDVKHSGDSPTMLMSSTVSSSSFSSAFPLRFINALTPVTSTPPNTGLALGSGSTAI
eukprot:1032097-Rhodomonas_salina.2